MQISVWILLLLYAIKYQIIFINQAHFREKKKITKLNKK